MEKASRQECRERERKASKFMKRMKGDHNPDLVRMLFLTGHDQIKEFFDQNTKDWKLLVLNPRHVNIKLDEEAFTQLNGINAPGPETDSSKTDSPSSTESSSSSSAPGDTGDNTIIPY